MLQKVISSLEGIPTIKRGEYNYFQHPLTDGTSIDPQLLKEICLSIIKIADVDVDTILTIEAMGIPVAVMLSEFLGKPVNIIRKVQRHLPGEIVLDQQTGYSRGKLYLNGITEKNEVLIVDIVISTGGTLIATINGLKKVNAKIKDIVCVIERDDGVVRVRRETGYNVKSLVRIEVNDTVRVVGSYFSDRDDLKA